jgi:hypothetical protein
MAGRDHWLSIARSTDPDDIREQILTGFKDGKPFTPYVPTIPCRPTSSAATGAYEAGECVEVDYNTETHQRRVLGRQSFAAVCDPGAQGHYETLLRSKI